jgi:hypothetical protein
MPIAIAATYDTYEAALLKGLPSTLRCPRDARLPGASLSILGSRVDRPVVVLVHDGHELVATRRVLSVALVLCGICAGRFRLLPADVLPYKRYGLAVIASIGSVLVEANESLREAAWSTHTGRTPAHSTVHAWTEGLGAFVLGRSFGCLPDAHPYHSIVAVIDARWSALEMRSLRPPLIDPLRYRTAARGERLAAVAGILTLAPAVLDIATLDVALDLTCDRSPLCSLRQLAVRLGVPAPLLFRTGFKRTPSEHVGARDPESPGLPQPTGDSVCQIRSRSPPSASSRSLPSSIPPSIPQNDGT